MSVTADLHGINKLTAMRIKKRSDANNTIKYTFYLYCRGSTRQFPLRDAL